MSEPVQRLLPRVRVALTPLQRRWGFASSLVMEVLAWRSRKAETSFYRHVLALAAADADPRPFSMPFVSLIAPIFNSPPSYLNALVASVRAQRAGSAELILTDDGSTNRGTLAWLERNAKAPDLRILRNGRNSGIAAATNAALEAARAPWVGFIDHDDALAPFALDRIYRVLSANPNCQFLYTDEVVADARLRPVGFHLKPAFDPVMLSGVNYLNHLSLYRRERLMALGGLREGFDGSQDYDLVLRYTRSLDRAQCLHLPYPAYLWRRDGAGHSAQFFARATENARRALFDAYDVPVGTALGSLHRIRFDERRRNWPLVSVIIPNRDSFSLISKTLDGLNRVTDYKPLEIIVVDNGTRDEKVLALYEQCRRGPIPFDAAIEDGQFNFSRAINKGIARAKGEKILLLNNDIEILSPDWLKEMVSCFDYPNVGIVGAKLLYPDRTIQHAGTIVGFGALAGHWYQQHEENFPGPFGRLWVRQSMSSVTGACLMISREALEQVGLLDEDRFAIAYNDVDLCLRAIGKGYRVIWTPFACFIHNESASRGSDETPANLDRFRQEQQNLTLRHATDRYDDFAISPWYSKNLSSPVLVRLAQLPEAR
jgi:O-antigen biosynthesis protein